MLTTDAVPSTGCIYVHNLFFTSVLNILSFTFSWCCPLQSLSCPVSVLSTHPPSSSVPWLIRPGYQAVSTECPFVDYSPRNHVAQLNYSWLQRLHLLLRHLEDALLNQPIAATTSMIPAHKESLLGYPCCP